ncbi:G1/S-specific cyclin CCN1 [Fusarium oxysporum f. sp. raphani]|uniref:G1/S-specific cyclin CCN1 n=1 Tax=Fusarium oxysporum f. sp. raphani TaxID=96318 RepID=A0A8J5PU49_FUSOX|nr:G1/S-specific cyclin CCN1 [Fusarium oxysporum f. sp. raphani]
MLYSQLDSSYFVEFDDHQHRITAQENETLPAASLIDEQPEIDWFKRSYLINFLVEAHAAFDLLPETLFLTVNLIDRYCTKRIVLGKYYQLAGCAALLIAAKYGDEKGRIPQIHQLEDICCGLYDAGLFTQMEWHVLETLDWVIGHPTVDFFSQLIVLEEGDDQVVTHMAAYLCEIALYHRDFVSTRPTVMARSSLDLARVILGRAEVKNEEDWDRMENATWIALLRHCQNPSPTLVRKYSTSGYSGVSQRLARFTAEQNAIAHRATGPATPRAKTINRYMGNIYSTSQHGHNVLHVHDYPTPPITPYSNCWMGSQSLPRMPRLPPNDAICDRYYGFGTAS